jgi:L-arabinose isomerase
MGDRYRMIVNTVDRVAPDAPLPRLPVARGPLAPHPDLGTSAESWIHAGGAHHTGFSFDLTVEQLEDFATMAGMEFLLIDARTDARAFRSELRWNDLYYRVARGV